MNGWLQINLGSTTRTSIREEKVALLDYIQKQFATTKLRLLEIAEEVTKECGVLYDA